MARLQNYGTSPSPVLLTYKNINKCIILVYDVLMESVGLQTHPSYCLKVCVKYMENNNLEQMGTYKYGM